jgi:hypothetical protein
VDFLDNKEVVITSGSAAGQRRRITVFDGVSQLTVADTFGFQIASGVTFLIGEQGTVISDDDILDWLNDAQQDVVRWLNDDALFVSFGKNVALTLATGVATVPADFHRPMFQNGQSVEIDSQDAPVFDRTQKARFDRDTTMTRKAIWIDGKLHYRPTTATEVKLLYVAAPITITTTQDPVPAELEDAFVDYAIYRGWLRMQTPELAGPYLEKYQEKIQRYNLQFQGRFAQ